MTAPYFTDANTTLYAGDCLDVLKTLPDNSVDAVVTDPPYGLGFMGKDWDSFGPTRDPRTAGRAGEGAITAGAGIGNDDRLPASRSHAAFGVTKPSTWRCDTCNKRDQFRNHSPKVPGCHGTWIKEPVYDGAPRQLIAYQSWCQAWATECLRVLKPGGHMLAFGGPRTYHRLASAIEDAGFEIRDSIVWIFGQGFPKSLNVSDALDRIVPVDARCVCAQHSTRTTADSPGDCPSNHGSGDEQPHLELGADLSSVPSPADARGRTHADLRADGQVAAQANTGLGVGIGRPASDGSARPLVRPSEVARFGAAAQFDMQTNKSAAPVSAHRRTEPRTQHTSGSAAGSALSSPWRNQYMACVDCGGFVTPKGLGTALKPSAEPIVVARKPIQSTVAANVVAHGTGALNIDACRVHAGDAEEGRTRHGGGIPGNGSSYELPDVRPESPAGRWPANVVLDGAMADELDKQSGTSKSPPVDSEITIQPSTSRSSYNTSRGIRTTNNGYGDQGGASRFFPVFRYTAKAATTERPTADGIAHPTVKSLELIRWLIRLVTPPGGTVLDPFAGSGTTAEAAIHEHKHALLIEREPTYLPLIVARLSKPMAVGFDFDEEPA